MTQPDNNYIYIYEKNDYSTIRTKCMDAVKLWIRNILLKQKQKHFENACKCLVYEVELAFQQNVFLAND